MPQKRKRKSWPEHSAGYPAGFKAQGPDTRSRGKKVREGETGNRSRGRPGPPGYPGREAGLGHVFALLSSNQKNGLKITPDTAIPQWHGEQMDNETAVDMLLQCD